MHITILIDQTFN